TPAYVLDSRRRTVSNVELGSRATRISARALRIRFKASSASALPIFSASFAGSVTKRRFGRRLPAAKASWDPRRKGVAVRTAGVVGSSDADGVAEVDRVGRAGLRPSRLVR